MSIMTSQTFKTLCMLLLSTFSTMSCYAGSFNYGYKTEIAFGNSPGVEFSSTLDRFARTKYKELNNCVLFDTKFIFDPRQVREYHLEKKPNKGNIGKIISNIVTQDGVQIHCTYFDRGKDKLVIVGEGFTNQRELMTPYLALFDDYDVVLFDFRGQGFKDFEFFDLDTWPLNIAQATFGMDSGLTSLGKYEENDVFAVVDHFKGHKDYKNVYGVSLCYSSFIFLKAQAIREQENKPLFDKIVLDGCWLNVPLVVEKIKKDPKIICSPQTGGWSDVWPYSEKWMQDTLYFLAESVWGLPIRSDVSILDYAGKIKKAELLFFHGKDDLMVPRDEFKLLWDTIDIEKKVALITSNPHVRNHLKQKEVYKLVANLFLELPFDTFKKYLLNEEELLKYESEQLTQLFAAGDLQNENN